MELLDLTQRLLAIFAVKNQKDLGDWLFEAIKNDREDIFDAFVEAVDGDLSVDWLQKVFQYYQADRKEKKQDFTPRCLAQFLSRLVGGSAETIDLCAGSGALTIQRWAENPDTVFTLYEIDGKVLPYLLFNLAIRNISATVYHGDVLTGGPYDVWEIRKGDRYGKVAHIKPTV